MSGRLARGAWFALGWAAVGLGTVGIVVPGLPTTVFFVIAAACFSRSSPRFEQWVLDRPGVGPLVRDYRAGLGMPRNAKVAAIAMIAVECSLSAFVALDPWWLRAVVLGLGAVGMAWIQWRVPTRADTRAAPLAPIGRWFRVVAFAEAATWLGLLVGMAVKYVGSGSEAGVQVFGPIHGVVVLVYVAITLLAARRLRWGGRTIALGLLASVPPLTTLVFEAWAERTGRLGIASRPPHAVRRSAP
jgi:integral membrane protein